MKINIYITFQVIMICKEFISCNNDCDESYNKNILNNYYSLHIPDISTFIDF